MKSIKILALCGLLALGGIVGGANPAFAATSYCSVAGSPNTDGLELSDVKLGAALTNSSDCFGIDLDNSPNNLADINNDWSVKAGTTFTTMIASGANANVLGNAGNALNFAFGLTGLGTNSGTWSLTITDPAPASTFPQAFDIVLLLTDTDPSTDASASYLFNNGILSSPGVVSGTWAFNWTASPTPGLNTATVFIGNGTPGGSGTPLQQSVVPEPASLLLLGSGLAAAAWRGRKKNAAK